MSRLNQGAGVAKNVKTWFAPIRALSFKDDVLTIQVPSQYVMNVWKSILWIY